MCVRMSTSVKISSDPRYFMWEARCRPSCKTVLNSKQLIDGFSSKGRQGEGQIKVLLTMVYYGKLKTRLFLTKQVE